MGVLKGDRHPFAGRQSCVGNIDTNIFRFIDTDFIVVVEAHMGTTAVDDVAEKSSARC